MEAGEVAGNAHQQEFPLNGLTFFSNFDSGNLASVAKFGQCNYELYVAPDAYARGQNYYRVWFYFGVRGLSKGQTLRFTLVNLSAVKAFSSSAYRPVYRELPKNSLWQRLPIDCRFEAGLGNSGRLSWSYSASEGGQAVYFAFGVPYTYENVLELLESIEPCKQDEVYYHSEVLTYSPDARPIHLLTLTHCENARLLREDEIPGLFPQGQPRSFRGKRRIVFLTARVHPGETPASQFLESLLRFLLSKDPRADALRRAFVFKIVPVVNVDGVVRGHFRVDQFGVNLNRSYQNPNMAAEPAVYAVKRYAEYLSSVEQQLYFYMDVHAQSSKRSFWLFGNALALQEQVENQLFAKLLNLNCAYFEYSDCDFSEKSMLARDFKDSHSKEGSARVALHKQTGTVYSYTLECPYYCPQPLFKLTQLVASGKKKFRGSETAGDATLRGVPAYNRPMFKEMAEGFAMALLDLNGLSPLTRLPSSAFKTLEELREHIKAKIALRLRLRHSKPAAAPERGTFRGRLLTPVRKCN